MVSSQACQHYVSMTFFSITPIGIFFQWIVCLGIWILGLFVHLYNGEERNFFPLVMVGGAIWCTGNMCVVPVIKTIGLAMGLLIWGTLNLIAGWATGRYEKDC